MKISRQDAKDWNEHIKLIVQKTTVDGRESAKDKRERIKRAKNDYAFFVEYYFPHYAVSRCGAFQVAAANEVCGNGKLRAVFEWARGHAKSTHFDLMIPMWLKAKGDLKVMVLVAKSESSAQTLLSNLQDEFEYNQRYIHDFGEQFNRGNWESGDFVTQDNTAFFALGRGQSPRGLRHQNNRPDYIVVDDVDDDELVQNDSRVAKVVDWILTALFNAMDMGRGRFILVGNRIHKNSVLANIALMPDVHHSVVNALDADGKPTWHEKYSKAEIEEVGKTIGTRRWQKEFFNNPMSDGSVFRMSDIQFKEVLPFNQYRYLIAYTDPSLRSHSKSDYKATVLVGKTATGEFHCIKAFVEQTTLRQMVRWNYQLFDMVRSHNSCYFYMESNFLQELLLDEFRKYGAEIGMQLPIKGDARNKPDKFQRIESMQPLFERGLFYFNVDEKDNPGMKKLIDQLLLFEKGSSMHDDGPDAVEGAIHILNQRTIANLPIIWGRRGEGSYRNKWLY